MLKSQSGEFPRDVTTRTDNVLSTLWREVKVHVLFWHLRRVARFLSQSSCLPYIHSTDHYITISYPVVTMTTARCLSGNLTYGPAHLEQIWGGFPQKSLSFNMAHLEVIKTGIYYY